MKVIIIGGGAAGLFCAGKLTQAGADVTIIEHSKETGLKILVTGKGRCNVTNDCDEETFLKNVRTNPKFLYSAIYGFPPSATMTFFENLGVRLKTERGRRVFPVSDNAGEIKQALEKYAGKAKIIYDNATGLVFDGDRVAGVKLAGGKILYADKVVVATGGTPIRPKSIPGIDLDAVVLAPEIIMGEKKIEKKKVVVVGSGITGLEVTEFLNDAGCEVTVIEMAPEVAPGAWFQLVDDEMERIKPFGTKFMTGTKLVGIEPGKVLVEDVKTGAKSALEADNAVLSLGVRPVNDMVTKLVGCGIHKVVTVGDAKKSGTIADATHSAYDTVMKIK